jgi:hypothetical protein
MTKYARGGLAITIASVPAEERARSGSQPRYPYQDSEPFLGLEQEQQVRSRSPPREYMNYAQARHDSAGRKVPREL